MYKALKCFGFLTILIAVTNVKGIELGSNFERSDVQFNREPAKVRNSNKPTKARVRPRVRGRKIDAKIERRKCLDKWSIYSGYPNSTRTLPEFAAKFNSKVRIRARANKSDPIFYSDYTDNDEFIKYGLVDKIKCQFHTINGKPFSLSHTLIVTKPKRLRLIEKSVNDLDSTENLKRIEFESESIDGKNSKLVCDLHTPYDHPTTSDALTLLGKVLDICVPPAEKAPKYKIKEVHFEKNNTSV
jgi:hypothetical protein